jgi:hypothetical protein
MRIHPVDPWNLMAWQFPSNANAAQTGWTAYSRLKDLYFFHD